MSTGMSTYFWPLVCSVAVLLDESDSAERFFFTLFDFNMFILS